MLWGDIITIRQFDVVEDKCGLQLYSNSEIIEKSNLNERNSIEEIIRKREDFKKEIKEQINNSQDFIEIECNGIIYRNIIIINFWHKKIKLMKSQIKKIEYFKGYSSAVRIELENEVYFMNAAINDTKLFMLMNNLF